MTALLNRGTPESEKQIPSGARVLLCFGEIDCRFHIVAQIAKTNSSMEVVVQRLAERSCTVIEEVAAWGYRPLVWNVVPSSPLETGGTREYLVVGTCAQRNEATRLLNQRLKEWCAHNECKFVDVYDQLVDVQGLSRSEFFMDPIQQSQTAMPSVVEWVGANYPDLVPSNFCLSSRHETDGDRGYEPFFLRHRSKNFASRLTRFFRS